MPSNDVQSERPVVIAALAGSLRPRSSALAAAKVALDAARADGAETIVLDVRELDLPLYRDDDGDADHAGVRRLVEVVRGCDGMIWSSPLYHGTVSGSFKNALDWLQLTAADARPYLTDKVIGLISTAGGTQGLQGVNTMEFIVRALRGWAVPLVLPIARAYCLFDESGKPQDATVEANLRALGGEVVRASRQFAHSPMTTQAAAEAESSLS